MAKVPGIWRTRSKVSEAELRADRRRTEERLAAIFSLKFESLDAEDDPDFGTDAEFEDGVLGVDDTDTSTHAATPSAPEPDQEEEQAPVRARAQSRPPIIVEGSRDLVPVMATIEVMPRTIGPLEDWDEPGYPQPELDAPAPVAEDVPAVAALEAPAVDEPSITVAEEALAVVAPEPPEAAAKPPKAVAKPPKAAAVAKPPKAAATRHKGPVAKPPKASVKPVKTAATRPPGQGAKSTKAMMMAAAWCPSCGTLLEPAPTASRRCAQCRERIIVKRVDGRTVFLAEAVLPVYEAERKRFANASRLARECQRWLRLAAIAGAPAEKLEARARSAVARPSEEAVAASRVLYLGTVERAYQQAKRERRWEEASRIRRAHALVLHREAGSPAPPTEPIVKLHRDAMAAALRGIAEMVRDAELVAAACCDACRADDRRIVRISAELRAPSLPHDGCPRGLCSCRWDLPTRHRATVQRYARVQRDARRRAAVESRGSRDQGPPTG